jgi:hypothetical protein
MSPALFAIEVDSKTGKDIRVVFVSYPAIENIQSRTDFLIRAAVSPSLHAGTERRRDCEAVIARGNKIDIRFGSAPLIK